MKQIAQTLLVVFLSALTVGPSARAGEARFFRIAGPVATTITAFSLDGYVTWTNAPTNTTFTVQTASSLLSPSNWVDYVQVPVTTAATTHRLFDPNPPANMALIPAGSFTMGDTLDGSSYALPLHTVYVSAFYMEKDEVTKMLWDEVYQWATNHYYKFDFSDSGQGKAVNHPAHTMTWYDAVKWCNARSEKEGRVPAYYRSAAQTAVYKTGQVIMDNSLVNWNSGYRLPTEAEWEKASRGGSSGERFPWGNTITHSQANYYALPLSAGGSYAYDVNPTVGFHPTFIGSDPCTSPVGYFAPNGYGLYDMSGNVLEWCWDWDASYSSGSQTDPRGPASGFYREGRGGSWFLYANLARSASRFPITPAQRGSDVGFRCVLGGGSVP